ncbi:MAG: sulfatase [Verrucomicrobiota bacterium]
MKLTPFVVSCLAIFAASLVHATAASPAGEKPNILFILADDLGWKDTSLYGSSFYETPNIERLAKRGMMFTQAYAASPLCSPTRGSILSGLYPGRIGITSASGHEPAVRLEASLVAKAPPYQRALSGMSATRLRTEYSTLAKALHDDGYVTGHFGKWHLGQEPYSPLEQGFDVDMPHFSGPGPAGSYQGPWKFPPKLNFIGKAGENIEDRMADEAMKFLRANKDKPFLLNYWAFSVHGPWDSKPELIEKYRDKSKFGDPQRNPVYGAMVETLDNNIGKLLDTLDELKIADNTIIVFFSDNGGVHWAGGDHGLVPGYGDVPITSNAPLRGGKATIYEGGTREPCVVVWPGKVKPGSQSDALFSSVDWYPTLLDMTGVTPKQVVKFDGVSEVPALLGKGAPRDTVFCFFPHYIPLNGNVPAVSVRRGDWKLIRFFCDSSEQTDRFELYNLKDDLGETRNLATEHPDQVKELDALISQHLKDINAVIPVKNAAFDPTVKMPPASMLEVSKKKTPATNNESGGKDIRQDLEKKSDSL